MQRRYIFPLLLVAGLFLAACTQVSPPLQPTAFKPETPSQPASLGIYLSDQAGQPLVAMDDIVAYSAETHAVLLTPAARERVAQLVVPTSGTRFQVRVGSETIYTGAFWPLYSSQSYDGVVIAVPIDAIKAQPGYTLRITLGYPTAQYFRGADPRSDPRILKALEQAGKLKSSTAPPSGTTVPTASAAIRGRVWHDLCKPEMPGQPVPPAPPPGCVPSEIGIYRANGILEPVEPGLQGIQVQLGAGRCPSQGLAATATDASGDYGFSGLAAGSYCVSVDNASPENAAGLAQGRWTFPALDVGATTVDVLPRDTRTAVNFGWDCASLP